MESGKDHDLLIRLDEKVNNLLNEVKLMRDNSLSRIESLEHTKVNKADQETIDEDHEVRMRRLERYMYIGFGIITAVQIFVDYALKIYVK